MTHADGRVMTSAASPSPRNGPGHRFQSRRAGRVDSVAARASPAVLASLLSPAGTPPPGLARPRVVLPCGLTGTRRPPAPRRPAALSVSPGPAERGAESDAGRLGSSERRADLRRRVSGMLMSPRQGSAAPATP